jgi:hypothetical protein
MCKMRPYVSNEISNSLEQVVSGIGLQARLLPATLCHAAA